MGVAASGNVNLTIPGLQNGDREMGGGAESEEADALAFLDAGDAEATEANDSSAQKRSGVEIIKGGGNGGSEIVAGYGVFGIASIDGVAGKGWGVAEVLFAAAAVGAGSIGAAEPGDADASAGCQRG
jgi:hypothetical protein